MVNKQLIGEFIEKFGGNYLTLNAYKKLSERDRMFHLFGHWNQLHDDGMHIIHSYRNGGTGELGEKYARVKISEIDKTIFIPHENSFILFKYTNRRGLIGEYFGTSLSALATVTAKHKFLNDNGIKITKKLMTFGKNGQLNFVDVDVF